MGPSAVAIPASQPCMLPDASMTNYPVPRELTKEEIQGIVKDYADAAHNAVEAGMMCLLTLGIRVMQVHHSWGRCVYNTYSK